MNTILWRAWEGLAGLAMPKLMAREMAVLLILAASLLVFRTLRERCLMVWIVGWVAYLASRHAFANSANPFAGPIGQTEFVIAVSLFVVGAMIYAKARSLLAPSLAICAAVVTFAGLQAFYWPASPTLRLALELSYRLLTWSAAIGLLRYRRMRREFGTWVLAVGLLLLHLDWAPLTSRIPGESGILIDVLLGLGMLLVILDEARLKNHRLATLNELSTTIADAAHAGSMSTATALHHRR
jgi:hypothetical protein